MLGALCSTARASLGRARRPATGARLPSLARPARQPDRSRIMPTVTSITVRETAKFESCQLTCYPVIAVLKRSRCPALRSLSAPPPPASPQAWRWIGPCPAETVSRAYLGARYSRAIRLDCRLNGIPAAGTCSGRLAVATLHEVTLLQATCRQSRNPNHLQDIYTTEHVPTRYPPRPHLLPHLKLCSHQRLA